MSLSQGPGTEGLLDKHSYYRYTAVDPKTPSQNDGATAFPSGLLTSPSPAASGPFSGGVSPV